MGKRVIVKVYSGPGRSNLNMLTKLRMLGVYLVPGVPNMTAVSQETDQSYGIFKSNYRGNLEKLAEDRFSRGKTLKITDLTTLVFGVEEDNNPLGLFNAFVLAFSVKKNLHAWRAVGACPLTRACLDSDKVRHELVQEADGTYNVDADPQSALLIQLEAHNRLCCDLLSFRGCDGEKLRKQAPSLSVTVQPTVTVRNSKARRELLMGSRAPGKHFLATGGEHLNSDDVFIAVKMQENEKQIGELETKKIRQTELQAQELAAQAIIQKHQV